MPDFGSGRQEGDRQPSFQGVFKGNAKPRLGHEVEFPQDTFLLVLCQGLLELTTLGRL
jgi:hypothetical protein